MIVGLAHTFKYHLAERNLSNARRKNIFSQSAGDIQLAFKKRVSVPIQ